MKKNLSINLYGVDEGLIGELWEHIRNSMYDCESFSFDVSKVDDTPIKLEAVMDVVKREGLL